LFRFIPYIALIALGLLHTMAHGQSMSAKKQPSTNCNRALHLQWKYPADKPQWTNAEILFLPGKSKEISYHQEVIHAYNLCSDSVELEITTADAHWHLWVKTGDHQLCILSPVSYHASDTNKQETQELIQVTYVPLDSNNSHREIHEEISDRMQPIVIETDRMDANNDFSLDAKTLHLQNGGLFAAKLESLPMVNVLKSGLGAAKPVVQGLIGLRVPIVKNGIRMEGQAWGLDHSPELDGWNIQSVVLLDAISSLLYSPDAWGKTIQAESTVPLHSGLAFYDYTQLIGLNSNGRGIQAAGKWTFSNKETTVQRFTWNARKQGNYSTPNYRTANTGLEEYSISYMRHYLGARRERTIHADGYFFKSGILLNSHVGSLTDLQSAIHQTQPTYNPDFSYRINKPQQISGQWMSSMETKKRINDQTNTTQRWSLQGNLRQEYDPHRNPSRTFPQLSIVQTTGKYQYIRQRRKSIFSAQQELQGQDYGGYYFVPSYVQSRSSAMFSNHFLTPNSTRTLTWAIRGDLIARNIWIPSVGMLVNIGSPQQQLYLAPTGAVKYENQHPVIPWNVEISHIWRQPGVNEMYASGVHHGTASFEMGNPNLKAEYGEKIEFSVKVLPWHVWINAFSVVSPNSIHVFPLKEPAITVRGAFPAYRYEQLPSYYGGVHVYHRLSTQNHRLQWENSIELIYATMLGESRKSYRHPALLPPPQAKSTLTYHLHHGIFTVEGRWVAQQRWFDARYDLLSPPPAYTVVNVRLTLTNFLGTQQTLVFFGDNITNRSYRDYMDRFRYFVDQPGANLGIRWQTNLHKHSKHNHLKN